ncbi:MAG TPA: BrnT family toxin [Anaerolineae bacterium]|nr:BrnT family toxin [Anaerolineae bacterium]
MRRFSGRITNPAGAEVSSYTDGGRYLFVVFTWKASEVVRVITARDMTQSERRFYSRRKR